MVGALKKWKEKKRKKLFECKANYLMGEFSGYQEKDRKTHLIIKFQQFSKMIAALSPDLFPLIIINLTHFYKTQVSTPKH